MAAVWLDADRSRWPICVYRLLREATDADLAAYFTEAVCDLRTRQVTFAIVEYGPFAPVSATHRQMLAEFGRRHADESRRYRYSMAIVVKSTLMRGVLTAIFWFQKPGAQHLEVFNTFEDAFAWTEAKVAQWESANGPACRTRPRQG